jgi:hypothetical protein
MLIEHFRDMVMMCSSRICIGVIISQYLDSILDYWIIAFVKFDTYFCCRSNNQYLFCVSHQGIRLRAGISIS